MIIWPTITNPSIRLLRPKQNQIVITFGDEYLMPESVILLLKVSETASIAVDFVELADHSWTGALLVPQDLSDGIYEYGIYINGNLAAYGTGSAVVNDQFAPEGPAIVQGPPGPASADMIAYDDTRAEPTTGAANVQQILDWIKAQIMYL